MRSSTLGPTRTLRKRDLLVAGNNMTSWGGEGSLLGLPINSFCDLGLDHLSSLELKFPYHKMKGLAQRRAFKSFVVDVFSSGSCFLDNIIQRIPIYDI